MIYIEMYDFYERADLDGYSIKFLVSVHVCSYMSVYFLQ